MEGQRKFTYEQKRPSHQEKQLEARIVLVDPKPDLIMITERVMLRNGNVGQCYIISSLKSQVVILQTAQTWANAGVCGGLCACAVGGSG